MHMSFVSTKQAINNEAEAKQLQRVLVHDKAPPKIILQNRGFKNLAPIHDISPNVALMLEIGRVDTWFTPKDMADWVWKLNPNLDLPHFSPPLSRHNLYIVTSKKLNPTIAFSFRKNIRQMQQDGSIKKIIERYRR